MEYFVQLSQRPWPTKLLFTIGLATVVLFVQFLIYPFVAPAQYLLLYPTIIVAALYGHAVVFALIGVIAAHFLFVEPRFSLASIDWPRDSLRSSIFLLASAGIGYLTRSWRASLHAAKQAVKEETLARQKAEEAVHALELERALRERFMAMVSHDLRNPITAAQAGAELMIRLPLEQQRAQGAQRIVNSLKRADRMIQNLLDATRIQAGLQLDLDREPCDLATVLPETVEELSLIYGPRFQLQIPNSLPGIWSALGIRRMIENLAGNAVKYGANDQPVTIRAELRKANLHLSVHNHGTELTSEEMESMFRLFERKRPNQKTRGWGIGLTIVAGVVDFHQGSLSLESREGHGTTVHVLLPIQPANHNITPMSSRQR